MKTPLVRKERCLSIPIPSFSNAVASPTSTPTPSPPPTIDPHWNKDRLLQVEAALQLHFKSQKRDSSGSLLPLSEFYALTQKVSNHAGSDDNTRPPSAHLDLSTEERDLYDLVGVASPILYKLSQIKRQELPAWKYASKIDPQDETMVWCLEFVQVAGNRIQAIQKMLAETKLEESKSQDILRVIRSHRDDQKKSSAEARSSVVVDSKPKAVESFLRPGMNIDERVRARADAKEKYREQLEAKAANASLSGGPNIQTDRTWLVRLADSLWFHSSHIMKRQDHFTSQKDKKKGSNCVLTLKDIVEVLSRPSAATSSRVPMHVNKSEKLTKREIVKAVQELRDLVPDWIHFVDTSDDQGRLSKDTTVWIKPVDYQGVRARLTGRPGKAAGNGLSILKRPPTLSGDRPQPDSKSLAQPRPLNKRPFTTPAAGTVGARVVTDESIDPSTADPLTKRPRIEIRSAKELPTTVAGVKRSATRVERPSGKELPTVAGVKRSAPDEPSTPPPQVKKPRGLRINPLLIISDADYNGGEVIAPTLFDSPRGLKSLFSQMNSGKRI
jgi:hypothetical protein